MTLPWTRARLTAQAALADASYAVQKANDAFDLARENRKSILCLALSIFILLILVQRCLAKNA